MMDLALPLIALFAADAVRRGRPSNAPIAHSQPQPTVQRPRPTMAPAPAPVPAPNTPPPAWPSAVPSDLPPFPGPAWQPHPQPARVASRAQALLPQLWRNGAGTYVIEQAGGDWVAFQAAQMGTKKGVVAFVPRNTAPRPPGPGPASARPRPDAPVVLTNAPASAAAPTQPPAHTSAPVVARPTVKKGSNGPAVADVQRRVGVLADGKFGKGTEAAVKRFQSAHGLKPDGIVGPNTWAALDAAGAAHS